MNWKCLKEFNQPMWNRLKPENSNIFLKKAREKLKQLKIIILTNNLKNLQKMKTKLKKKKNKKIIYKIKMRNNYYIILMVFKIWTNSKVIKT
jgi:hypothetical protein